MTVIRLLDQLAALDVRLWVDGDRLHFDAPKGTITPAMLDELRRHKPELIGLLAERPRARSYPCACCGRFFFHEPATICYWCRPKPAGAEASRHPGLPGRIPHETRTENGKGTRCLTCGGGRGRKDPPGGPCWSCRRFKQIQEKG